MYKEFYGEPPFHHHHHMGPMEHEHIANAAAYARLNTKLSVHMNDDSRHITDEEREKWNEAADKAITDVDEILAEKADVEDIPTKLSDLEDDKGFITQTQFGSIIDGLNERFIPYSHLNELLVGYVREEQLGQYIKNTDILFTYGGSAIRKGDSITPASGGESIHVDPYVLPVATATALGGIKVGTSNASLGNNKYPVQLTTNQVAYVYVPGSSGSGGEMTYEYIPTYSIAVMSSTMHRSGSVGQYKVEGLVQWRVMKYGESIDTIAKSNSEEITCEVWMNNRKIDSVKDQLQTSIDPIRYLADTKSFSFDLNSNRTVYFDNVTTDNLADTLGTYVNIRVYKASTNLVASVVVPIRIDGENGQSGSSQTQALDYPLIRIRQWTSTPSPSYNNGDRVENGVKYIDVVSYSDSNGYWGYYKCTQYGTTDNPVKDANGRLGSGWSVFTTMGDAAFNTLLANSAFIQSLTAKLIVVTDNNNNPVGGMVSGNSIPTELGDATNNNGIRIFAGQLDETGDLYSAPFTVDNNGHVKAEDIELTGTIHANILYTSYKIREITTAEQLTNMYANLSSSDMAQKIVIAYTVIKMMNSDSVPSNLRTVTINLPSAENYAGQEIEIIFPSGYSTIYGDDIEYVPATLILSGVSGLRSPLCTSRDGHYYHLPVNSVSSSMTWADANKWMVSRVRLLSIPEITYREPEWGGNVTNYYWLILDSTNLIYDFPH